MLLVAEVRPGGYNRPAWMYWVVAVWGVEAIIG
jgi:hypothetical protein